ncbi:2-oxoglutarate dehydrogenase E1 component [Paraburkholderia youngii]|uniref:2-oxoglutarate dehydrogenase E1 component n=1 Tax=Paraburkholderia youngii TaxID=2782701 RepID=UPI0015910DEE|nr:2-oxoglutarate dehydrogenase E1 component [Paraburkholderia youngii]NUX58476.1 2-oxoglutarate dehydrogenase E1 component [Paraburkholderia youngii]
MRCKYHKNAIPFTIDSQSHPTATASPSVGTSPIERFIDAYRWTGYRVASIDPLGLLSHPDLPELTAEHHGLTATDRIILLKGGLGPASSIGKLEKRLKSIYCGAIGLDCSGVRDKARQRWLFEHMESLPQDFALVIEHRRAVLSRLLSAEMWERNVADLFGNAKRFSLEGCESLIPLLDAVVESAGHHAVNRMFLGMHHRGRLNALTNFMGLAPKEILASLDSNFDLDFQRNDLLYHLGGIALKKTPYGEVSVMLAHNPSHLESVYPVVAGMARAYKDNHPKSDCITVIVHGDAAFAGQGVVMETLMLTRRKGYSLGGVIHVIVNNQVGGTTPNEVDRDANVYCTDISRAVDVPVLHVNAEHPDAVVTSAKLAFEYRKKFSSDIVIDLIGYRRFGHFEQDIAAITQPGRQRAIDTHPTVTELYYQSFDGIPPLDLLRKEALHQLHNRNEETDFSVGPGVERKPDQNIPIPSLSFERLLVLTKALTRVPQGFVNHSFVDKLLSGWRNTVSDNRNRVSWSFAENLAYASLLDAGYSVRISGIDVERGTFMHRHAVWHFQRDQQHADAAHIPLTKVSPRQGKFDIVNSPLTEEAVVAFEYGYSVESPSRLIIWEAQLGDFANGAQVIFDQYIAAGEYKWGYRSRLVVLLPHGHEGDGSEHSNGYMGRFLQLCASDNLRVICPSTSAQWFHLLRQQATALDPKPLIVMAPKRQLRSEVRSHSVVSKFLKGTFRPMIGDSSILDAAGVRRLVLSSGKFYYALRAARDCANSATALIRVEQLYPFPRLELARILVEFCGLREVVWAQEEDANQGAWRSIRDELESIVPAGILLVPVCRTSTAAGAHSSVRAHLTEQHRLVREALGESGSP